MLENVTITGYIIWLMYVDDISYKKRSYTKVEKLLSCGVVKTLRPTILFNSEQFENNTP